MGFNTMSLYELIFSLYENAVRSGYQLTTSNYSWLEQTKDTLYAGEYFTPKVDRAQREAFQKERPLAILPPPSSYCFQ